ncbi:MAG: hypothetical protein ACRCU0_02620 [Candidatus Rhabdochlamydia sp.]
MYFFLLSSLVCIPCLLCANIILDQAMTPEDQRKTGITKLNRKQKLALESWLNENFNPKEHSSQDQEPLSLSINIDNGQKLQLSDNSIWEVHPQDVDISAVWITPFPLQIEKSTNPTYPFLLKNTRTQMSVRARKSSYNPVEKSKEHIRKNTVPYQEEYD